MASQRSGTPPNSMGGDTAGMMQGMLWSGIALPAVPVAVLGIAVYWYLRSRSSVN